MGVGWVVLPSPSTRRADTQQGGAASQGGPQGVHHGIGRLLQMSRAGQEGPHGAGQTQPPSGFLWAASRPCGAHTPLWAEPLIACEAERLAACYPASLVLTTLRVGREADLPSTDARTVTWTRPELAESLGDEEVLRSSQVATFSSVSLFFQVSDNLPPSPLPFLNNLPLPAGHQGPLVSFWPRPQGFGLGSCL